EVTAHKTALSFVDSIAEIFGSILGGSRLVIAAREEAFDAGALLALLERQAVTRIVVVPSLLRVLLEVPAASRALANLRHWTTSGEALSAELRDRFGEVFPSARLINLYGSSEVAADATGCTAHPVHDGTTAIAIGRPLHNTRAYTLDQHFGPASIGAMGE